MGTNYQRYQWKKESPYESADMYQQNYGTNSTTIF